MPNGSIVNQHARFIPQLHLLSRGKDAVSTSSELGIVHHCRSLIIG
jgi:hypothetical protein